MNEQKVLEESIERMNVWCEKHPTGVLTITGHGARLRIVPQENGWKLQSLDRYGNAALIGAFTREDVQKLVHKVLRFSWEYELKE